MRKNLDFKKVNLITVVIHLLIRHTAKFEFGKSWNETWIAFCNLQHFRYCPWRPISKHVTYKVQERRFEKTSRKAELKSISRPTNQTKRSICQVASLLKFFNNVKVQILLFHKTFKKLERTTKGLSLCFKARAYRYPVEMAYASIMFALNCYVIHIPTLLVLFLRNFASLPYLEFIYAF